MPPPTESTGLVTTLDLEQLDVQRLLVVGAAPRVLGISVLTWEEFAERMPNIADYSLVVLVLDSLDVAGGQPLRTFGPLLGSALSGF